MEMHVVGWSMGLRSFGQSSKSDGGFSLLELECSSSRIQKLYRREKGTSPIEKRQRQFIKPPVMNWCKLKPSFQSNLYNLYNFGIVFSDIQGTLVSRKEEVAVEGISKLDLSPTV
jgi:hypothetical protein